MKTIGIIGLGVMGASFASRLSHKGYTVYGLNDPRKHWILPYRIRSFKKARQNRKPC